MKRHRAHFLFAAVFAVVAWFVCTKLPWDSSSDELVPASIVGVQHLGRDYPVSDFYIDEYGGGSIGRDGGGGGSVCCVMIPLHWRPGLTVEVRWRVENWSRENRAQIQARNYESVTTEGIYKAEVPVEKYEEPGDVYVHFLPKGRVRVVSTMYSVTSTAHPVPYGPTDGGPIATVGAPIQEMFTQSELQKMRGKNTWK